MNTEKDEEPQQEIEVERRKEKKKVKKKGKIQKFKKNMSDRDRGMHQ